MKARLLHLLPWICVWCLLIAASPTSVGTAQTTSVAGRPAVHSYAEELEYVGQVGGVNLAVAVQGAYAYVGEGPRVTVLDISNPASPMLVGKTPPFSDIVRDIGVAGDHVYVAAGASGLHVVDVSMPSDPTVVGTYDSPGQARGVAVVDAHAYIADELQGMRVVDVSTPSAPKEVGAYETLGGVWSLAIDEGIACVVGLGPYLRVVDVSTPSAPKEISAYETPSGPIHSLVMAEGFVYGGGWDDGMVVVDVSTPGKRIPNSSDASRRLGHGLVWAKVPKMV